VTRSWSTIRWFSRPPANGGAAPLPRFDRADFTPALHTRLLVLQPTPFCNLDCDYCYLPQRHVSARMAPATAALAARRLLDDGLVGDELTVVWHAGEPTTLPVAWYEDTFGRLHEVLGAHTTVRHALQTNATLIDDAWCALLSRWQVQVGVSLDGPAALHDRHRTTRSGRGTHARTLRGLRRLQAAGIECHAIAVVTADTLAAPDDFIDFFEQQGLTQLGCNFDEAEGVHTRSSLAGQEAAHAAFLQRLLARCSAPGARLQVRELAMAQQLVARPLPLQRWRGHAWPDNAQGLPFALVNVAHDGGFGTFSPELLGQHAPAFAHFVFGNVHEGGVLAAAAHPAFLRCWQQVLQGITACERECAHFGFCGGGSPANKLYELGTLAGAETLYCRSMLKRPFDAVLAHAEQALQPPAALAA
jgi:uncharacterized protein